MFFFFSLVVPSIVGHCKPISDLFAGDHRSSIASYAVYFNKIQYFDTLYIYFLKLAAFF